MGTASAPGFAPWARVLPQYFKPLGYRAYHSGKWHLNNAPRPVRDGGGGDWGGWGGSLVIHDLPTRTTFSADGRYSQVLSPLRR